MAGRSVSTEIPGHVAFLLFVLLVALFMRSHDRRGE